MFENAKENGLVDTWQLIQNIPYKAFGTRIQKSDYPVTRKNDDIFKMFMYLNLVKTPRNSFKKASSNFLVYSEVHIFLILKNIDCVCNMYSCLCR